MSSQFADGPESMAEMYVRTGLPCDLAVGSKGAAFKSEILGALSRCLFAASGASVMLDPSLSWLRCIQALDCAVPSTMTAPYVQPHHGQSCLAISRRAQHPQ